MVHTDIAHVATQGITTKNLRRTLEMFQFAAFHSATQGNPPENLRREQLANRPTDFAARAFRNIPAGSSGVPSAVIEMRNHEGMVTFELPQKE